MNFVYAILITVGTSLAAINPMPGWMYPPSGGSGGVSGAAIADSLRAHGLGADSSAWFSLLNRTYSVGPEWGDSTPGAQVGIQAAGQLACDSGWNLIVPPGKYLFTNPVVLEDCKDMFIDMTGSHITVQDNRDWTPWYGLQDSVAALPGLKAPFILVRPENVTVRGYSVNARGVKHQHGVSGGGIEVVYGKNVTVEKARVRNVYPDSAGVGTVPKWGGWTNGSTPIRYDGIRAWYTDGWTVRTAYVDSVMYSGVSGRCQVSNILYDGGGLAWDVYEGWQSAGFGGACINDRGVGVKYSDISATRYRAQGFITHNSAVQWDNIFAYDAFRSDSPFPMELSGARTNSSSHVTISNSVFINATSRNEGTQAHGAISSDRSHYVNVTGNECYFTENNDYQYCYTVNDTASFINVSDNVFRRASSPIRLNGNVFTFSADNNTLTGYDNRGFDAAGNNVHRTTLSNNKYYPLTSPTTTAIHIPSVSSTELAIQNERAIIPLGSTGFNVGTADVRYAGNTGFEPGIIWFSDTVSAPAIKGTHKPTVQAMGDADITVNGMTEVVVTTTTLTAARTANLQDPSVYGPNRCITVRDGGFVNGANVLTLDPGVYTVDGVSATQDITTPYGVIKWCTDNAATQWISD